MQRAFPVDILTDKRVHSNLAIAPTCDTVSTYHITDNARDPQRGLSCATYTCSKSVAGQRSPTRRRLDEFLRGPQCSPRVICIRPTVMGR
eukprot:scaffold33808_cov36-Phaeocystis_antarctica.AAC.2